MNIKNKLREIYLMKNNLEFFLNKIGKLKNLKILELFDDKMIPSWTDYLEEKGCLVLKLRNM